MIQIFKLGAAAALSMWFGAAVAAPDRHAHETRPVDARVVRVKVEGVVDLKLRQGAVPSLVFIGERELLDKLTTDQHGDTLTIGTVNKRFKLNRKDSGLRAELTLPELREVSSDSVGATEVAGFSGDELDLHLDGAGSMKVHGNYRLLNVVLGGVGSMVIHSGNVEGVDVNLRGAGFMTLRGNAKWLKASLGGLGNLDAQHLQADTVNLELSGLGNAAVSARQNANLNLSGLGSVQVYGKPVGRSVSVNGLGKVVWK